MAQIAQRDGQGGAGVRPRIWVICKHSQHLSGVGYKPGEFEPPGILRPKLCQLTADAKRHRQMIVLDILPTKLPNGLGWQVF